MRLVVLGANGRTGTQVIRRAVDQGDQVTAVVRSEAKRPALEHERLKVVVGNPCDAAFLTDAFRDQDAVISTLGGRAPTKKATSVYHASADAILEATRNNCPRKLVVTSSALLFPPRRLFDRCLAVLARNVVRSATRMEQSLRAAEFDVTIARCGFLVDSEEEEYRALENALPERGSSVSRQSLAHFLVNAATRLGTGHQVYGVSGPGKRKGGRDAPG